MAQSQPVLPDGRRYQILDVIGRGGFGNVYRARLESAGGFYKDVAIKIARDADAPAEALERFRDEARILGLIRDRALVSVDPPMKLDGRWAVVMEFVDGASCSRLVVRYGGIPPTVVMEIGAEIARVLHKIYRHPGTDGQPLRLVHRDIKPANIQITPSGEVKLLDFGIARAEFRDRESVTVMTIGGTRGYIAPERATGLESPAGDVYSLGVVLHKLITGRMPDEDDLGWENGDPEPFTTGNPRDMVLSLAYKMRSLRPNVRPEASEVRRMLLEMRRNTREGESLESWAKRVVPEVSRLAEDDLVGTTLAEDDSLLSMPSRVTDLRFLALAGALVLVGLLVVGLIFGPLGSSSTAADPEPNQPVAPAPVPENPQPNVGDPVPSPEPVAPGSAPAPAPVQPGTPVPAPTPASVAPTPSPAIDPAPSPSPSPTQPAPQAIEPAPAPAPEPTPPEPDLGEEGVEGTEEPPDGEELVEEPVPLAMLPVRITSIPMGATVKIDGRVIGPTPQLDLQLTEGEHQVEITSDQGLIKRRIQVGEGRENRFVWRIATGAWEEGF